MRFGLDVESVHISYLVFEVRLPVQDTVQVTVNQRREGLVPRFS